MLEEKKNLKLENSFLLWSVWKSQLCGCSFSEAYPGFISDRLEGKHVAVMLSHITLN